MLFTHCFCRSDSTHRSSPRLALSADQANWKSGKFILILVLLDFQSATGPLTRWYVWITIDTSIRGPNTDRPTPSFGMKIFGIFPQQFISLRRRLLGLHGLIPPPRGPRDRHDDQASQSSGPFIRQPHNESITSLSKSRIAK